MSDWQKGGDDRFFTVSSTRLMLAKLELIERLI